METYNIVKSEYDIHLKELGVNIPGENSQLGQALCCLYENIVRPVSTNDIIKYVSNKLGVDAIRIQVRHLALQKGFNVIKGGEVNPTTNEKIPNASYLLLNLTEPHPSFIPTRRNNEIDDEEWREIKRRFGNMCVNCGSKEGEHMRWNIYDVTILQRGHMDPRLPLTTNNIIPQCKFCNQQYRNNAIFNNRGFVIDYNPNGFT
jgi:hypothetical protein